jgi:steroid delta-isomerase-like uncharacterized protein
MNRAMSGRDPRPLSSATDLSRRTALRRLGGSGLAALALATGSGRAAGQEATPPALPALLGEWEAAMATHDPDQILTLFTDDALWEEVALNVAASGPEAIRAHLEGVFAATPDISYDVTGGFAAGDRMAAEWIISGTLTGDFPGLPPGTGQPFTVRGVSIFDLRDGRIARYTEYWDAFTFLVQLGALPAPGASAAGTPSP